MAVGHDAHRWVGTITWQATGQFRIVCQDRAHTDHHRVVPAAQSVGGPARSLASDPAALAGLCGDPAVEGGGELECDGRAAETHAGAEPGCHFIGLVLQDALVNHDTGCAQFGDPGAIDPWVRISRADHHTANAGGGQRVGAGRSTTPVTAWLQRHVDGRAARCRPSDIQRRRLGVGPAAGGRDRTTHHTAVLYHHTTHRRIGPGITYAPSCQRQCRAHMRDVLGSCGA